MASRTSALTRETRETEVTVRLALDGAGAAKIATGLGFLDHLLTALACHARFDLELSCRGDLEVDDHHTVEDCALALGAAIDEALADRSGIARFGDAYAPLDEALARAVVDLSGRPYAAVSLGLARPCIGDVAAENVVHAFRSLATAMRAAIHLDVLRGENDHHKAEAAAKALALALRKAVAVESGGVPSTKGVLG
ncbi:MAG: imidazoleglycerol-phosphate dehydratase HisB [Proteobacteria bacterium]|jgi:imidazoleglycerol phosphate dehydratase HisB|nr:imidazoleglycerol-phosphate dehydratase HisB [Pseudomonadota bacterium]